MRPLISCILVVHNNEQTLEDCLRNVWRQDYPNLEIVVVDDASGDRTPEILAHYGRHIRVVRQSLRRGLANSRNAGVQHSRGRLLVFADVNEPWAPHKLAVQLQHLLAHHDCAGCVGHLEASSGALWTISTLMCRREVFEELGGFNSGLRDGAEADWFARAREAGLRIDYLPSPLGQRVHERPRTATHVLVQRQEALHLIKAHLDRKRLPSDEARYLEMRQRVRAAAPFQEVPLRLVGRTVWLRVAGEELFEALMRVWQPYLAEPHGAPRLTIELAELPTLALPSGEPRPEWRQEGLANEPDGEFFGAARPGVAAWLDRRNRHLVACVHSLDELPPSELGRPLFLTLLRWLADEGQFVFRGAVVAHPDRGAVLLVGGENSGKSTALWSAIAAGWRFVADDLVILKPCPGGFAAFPLHASSWLDSGWGKRAFPQLRFSMSGPRWDGKGMIWPEGRSLQTQAILKAAVLLDGDRLPARPCSPAQVLRGWVPTSFFRLAGLQNQAKLDLACRCLTSLPCWRLGARAPVEALPDMLLGCLN